MNMKGNKYFYFLLLVLLIANSCNKENPNCVCSSKLEFKLGDLGPAVKGAYNDIISTGESNLIKLSILNSSLCPFANMEIIIKDGSKIIHKKNYLDPISQVEILVPEKSELVLEANLVDGNSNIQCKWLGNIECKIEY